jgi:restriction endonuclease Mrr
MTASRTDKAAAELPPEREFLHPVLETLRATGGQLSTRELNDRLADHFSLSATARKLERPSGGCTVFYQRLSWVLTHLKSSGVLEQPSRGQWRLTRQGEVASQDELLKANAARPSA